ncbi:MAG: hypothetical protein ACKVW3_06610 [Phycisphaerales bacterium]
MSKRTHTEGRVLVGRLGAFAGGCVGRRALATRRGGVYFAVLGASMLVGLIGITVVAEMRSQRQGVVAAIDGVEARQLADSAIEAAVADMKADQTWRSRTAGDWARERPLGRGAIAMRVVDPVDGDVGNRPNDPVLLTGIGIKGNARQMTQVRLTASGSPLDSLSLAMHADGGFEIAQGAWLTAYWALIATHGNIQIDGTFAGIGRAKTRTGPGLVVGMVTLSSQTLTVASVNSPGIYEGLGTVISPPSNRIENVVLGPGVNPYGAANADGLYVVRTNSDLTVRNCRIYGTLVVICGGGAVVHVADRVFMHPARADYPGLLVEGDLVLEYESAATNLSEATVGVNFNPAGAPYQGVSDADLTDTYPSEVRGLIHATGAIELTATATIRGVILSSLTGGTAVTVNGNCQLFHDATIAQNPPMGYTESVTMSVQGGTWARVVDP